MDRHYLHLSWGLQKGVEIAEGCSRPTDVTSSHIRVIHLFNTGQSKEVGNNCTHSMYFSKSFKRMYIFVLFGRLKKINSSFT